MSLTLAWAPAPRAQDSVQVDPVLPASFQPAPGVPAPLQSAPAVLPADSTAALPRAAHSDTGKHSDSVSVTIFPLAFYSPETKVGAALAGGFYKRFPDRDRPSSLETQLLFTQRKQYALSAHAGHWLPRLSGFLAAGLSFSEFPDQFYGVGNGAQDADLEHFSARTISAEAEANKEIFKGLRAGGSAGWAKQKMIRTDSGGLLRRGAVTGSGSWTGVRMGPKLEWDTRNSAYFPTRGTYLTASLGEASRFLGSDFDFGSLDLSARGYVPVGSRGVFALQGLASTLWGDIPFPFLAKIGGSEVLRGYYQGRYRDRNLACLQSEYRFWIWRRLGAAAFASTGLIAADPAGFADAPLRYGYGGGLRYRLNEEGVNLRGDFAIPRSGDAAVYITFAEAF